MSLKSNHCHSVLPRLLSFVLIVSFYFSLKAETKITDAITGQPLPKASIFDKNGVFIAVADDEGMVPQNISQSSFPISVRYVGYVPLKLTSPDLGVVTMDETFYTLPEVVVDEVSRNILYLQVYVREYHTAENSKDTIASFTEQLVDYAIPLGKAKYKGWKKPRVLSQQEFEYKKIEKKNSSIDTLMLKDGGKMKSTNFNIAQKFKMPECILSGDSTKYVKYGKYYPEEKWTASEGFYIIENDGLASYKDHIHTMNFLGIIGASQTMDDSYYKFEKLSKPGVGAENLIEASQNWDLSLRGKLMNKASEQKEDTKMSVYSEMYVIDRAYLTADEAKELKKDVPMVAI